MTEYPNKGLTYKMFKQKFDKAYGDVTMGHSSRADNRLHHLHIDTYVISNCDERVSAPSRPLLLPKFKEDTLLSIYLDYNRLLNADKRMNQARERELSKEISLDEIKGNALNEILKHTEMKPQHFDAGNLTNGFPSILKFRVSNLEDNQGQLFRLFPKLSTSTLFLIGQHFPFTLTRFDGLEYLEYSSYNFTNVPCKQPDN
jgi:hypothetical protein